MIQKKLPFTIFTTIALFFFSQSKAQLYINSATFFIQPGATVTVQGNVTSNTSIDGTGLVILNGSSNQTVDMGGFAIPNLQINNSANATLLSSLLISDSLYLTSGKITLGANNLTLATTAGTVGGSTTSFIETNSTGQAIKDLAANVTGYEIPVGLGTSFRPAFITTAGTYSASANVGVEASGVADPNKPPMISDYLLTYWPVTQTGITGTLNVAGQYLNSADISGSQANLKGYFFNGTDWSSATGTSTTASNQVATNVTTASGDVYGMDGFIVLKTKVFLQAAYNTTTGVMNDNLRTTAAYSPGNPPTGNLIPSSDPYRTAPYNTAFTQVNDAIAETAPATAFYDQTNPDNNIVDWVFLELRNTASPGNTILQTRSALLQRSGNIVDVDGVSPVTFNNLSAGSYTVAVLHRNHLGLSANPATNTKALSETQSTSTVLDLTTAAAGNLYGTAGTNYYNNGTVNMLYAGNANMNTNVKYNGPSNDPAYILSTVLSGNISGSVSAYSVGDVNLNRVAKYNGPGNDAAYILATSLSGAISGIKSQSLPN